MSRIHRASASHLGQFVLLSPSEARSVLINVTLYEALFATSHNADVDMQGFAAGSDEDSDDWLEGSAAELGVVIMTW